ncbi:ferritin-like domain-containing protein [Ephemerocybe angulata]|uniref:Ferritin-like domain-containing protein n=1 Tax=Ephemerocybe angulata TaxID=980116 RepID=A0A8H6LYA1_9AGAR|nr:ferritin-like domain-containing protein [Tulosesus angulatus]
MKLSRFLAILSLLLPIAVASPAAVRSHRHFVRRAQDSGSQLSSYSSSSSSSAASASHDSFSPRDSCSSSSASSSASSPSSSSSESASGDSQSLNSDSDQGSDVSSEDTLSGFGGGDAGRMGSPEYRSGSGSGSEGDMNLTSSREDNSGDVGTSEYRSGSGSVYDQGYSAASSSASSSESDQAESSFESSSQGTSSPDDASTSEESSSLAELTSHDDNNGSQLASDQRSGSGSGYASASGSSMQSDSSYKNSNDLKVLNLALHISHLAYAFYTRSLSLYSAEDFASAGYPDWVRGRYEQVREHASVQGRFLEGAVKGAMGMAVQECGYQFPDTSVKEFVNVSEVLALLAVGAFNGAVRELENREYAEVMASIMGVEARHAAWINSAVKEENGWDTAFETRLTFNQAWTILSNFIASCPSQPADILPEGLHAFAPLTIPEQVKPGIEFELSYPVSPEELKDEESQVLFGTFTVGMGTYVQRIRTVVESTSESDSSESSEGCKKRHFVTPPVELRGKGAVYISVVKTMDGANEQGMGLDLRDERSVVAGPAIVMFPYNSRGEEEQL